MTVLDKNLSSLGNRLFIGNYHNYQFESVITVQYSKTGEAVPVIRSNEQSITLHSLYNPILEAQKLREAYTAIQGFYVFLGLGAAFHIREFLQSKLACKAFIIENCKELFFKLLQTIDYSDIFSHETLFVFVDVDPYEISLALQNRFNLLLDKFCTVIPLRSRTNFIDTGYFIECAKFLERQIKNIVSDYGVQAQFGYQWMKNIFKNLWLLHTNKQFTLPKDNVLITGAGPSLEYSLSAIKERRATHWLLATDTSAGFLLAHDIMPDAVISIDCQQYSTLHFLHELSNSTTVFLDIASPPSIARKFSNRFFFGSYHPLSVYLHAKTQSFPLVDCSGGNVLFAACDLVAMLGAKSADIYGADFSYPEGKLYARGTYLYNYFAAQETRFVPMTTLFMKLLLRTPISTITLEKGKFRYETDLLTVYRDSLQKKVQHYKTHFIFHTQYGLYLEQKNGNNYAITKATLVQNSVDTCTLLNTYFEQLSKLKTFLKDYSALQTMEPEMETLFLTIQPFLLFLTKRNNEKNLTEIFPYAIELIEKELSKRHKCYH